jgi:hypothetical protein
MYERMRNERIGNEDAIMSPIEYLGGDIVVSLRPKPYVYVTWLAKLISGEVQCEWQYWFKTRYLLPSKPSSPRLATYMIEHNECLGKFCKTIGSKYYREGQNYFKVKRGKLEIHGKPDVIVPEKDNSITIYDFKTGNPSNADIIQVMLYMSLVPHGIATYKGKNTNGLVVYKSGDRVPILGDIISNESYKGQAKQFLDMLEADEAPPKTPSYIECQYCDIAKADCGERIEIEEEPPTAPNSPI